MQNALYHRVKYAFTANTGPSLGKQHSKIRRKDD